MSIERIDTNARTSRIVIHGDTIYLCGQVAADASAGIQEQTRTMLAKVDALLQQAGSDRHHMLAATIYLADMADFQAMNEVWNDWVPTGSAPARACVSAAMARAELKVEISVTAAKIQK